MASIAAPRFGHSGGVLPIYTQLSEQKLTQTSASGTRETPFGAAAIPAAIGGTRDRHASILSPGLLPAQRAAIKLRRTPSKKPGAVDLRRVGDQRGPCVRRRSSR
jgi:hypothetical protein